MNKTPLQMMDLALDRLRTEVIKSDPQGTFCSITLQAGAEVPYDYGAETGCAGMMWVRLVSANPTLDFPQPDVTAANCTYSLAYYMEVGVVRNAPVPVKVRNDIKLPTDEEIRASTEKTVNDMTAMHDALVKLRRDVDELTLGEYTAVGPNGGVVGGMWTFAMGNEDPDS